MLFRVLISFIFLVESVLPAFAALPMSAPVVSMRGELPLLQAVRISATDPFELTFLVNPGTADSRNISGIKNESLRLVKYFMAGLTIPTTDLWVNLSPLEKDRIVPEALGQTLLGKELLSQDYILKEATASLLTPETSIGNVFWNKVYSEAEKVFGTTDIPIEALSKVWIVPELCEVSVGSEGASAVAVVTKAKLRVMLDSDYVALKQSGNNVNASSGRFVKDVARRVLIPVLEKEVNEGEAFASLRQVYYSLILAAWYKNTLQGSILNQVYSDKKKIGGVNINDKRMPEKIWNKYVEVFSKGAFSVVKEDVERGEVIPRKYFSGGVRMDMSMLSIKSLTRTALASLANVNFFSTKVKIATVDRLRQRYGWQRPFNEEELKQMDQIYNEYSRVAGFKLPLSRENIEPYWVKSEAVDAFYKVTSSVYFALAGVMGSMAAITGLTQFHAINPVTFGIPAAVAGLIGLQQWFQIDDFAVAYYDEKLRRMYFIEGKIKAEQFPYVLAHEMAHLLNLPNNRRLATAYEILIAGPLLGLFDGAGGIVHSRTRESYVNEDILLLAEAVNEITPDLSLQEVLVREYSQLESEEDVPLEAISGGAYVPTIIGKRRLLLELKRILSRVRESSFKSDEGRENRWTYEYGATLSILAAKYYKGNLSKALAFIYFLGLKKDSKAAVEMAEHFRENEEDAAMRGGIDFDRIQTASKGGPSFNFRFSKDQLMKFQRAQGLAPFIEEFKVNADIFEFCGNVKS
nr:Hypothetical protein JG1_0250 [uncultured bacterium]